MHPHLNALSGQTKSIVMLLHGYGADGNDLIDIAAHWQPHLPNTHFVSPHAPQACSIMPSGRQWFALNRRDKQEFIDGVKSARPQLQTIIDEQLKTHNLHNHQMALVGFSQGTMMALHIGLNQSEAFAAIIGYSGLLAIDENDTQNFSSKPPVLLCHGTYDEVIPFQAMAMAQQYLHTQGIDVSTYGAQGVGHGIDQTGLIKGLEFLSQHLPK